MSDPFAYCRRHGIRVAKLPGSRRWLTWRYSGTIGVVINATLSAAEQRNALAEALLAHPIAQTKVSRT